MFITLNQIMCEYKGYYQCIQDKQKFLISYNKEAPTPLLIFFQKCTNVHLMSNTM